MDEDAREVKRDKKAQEEDDDDDEEMEIEDDEDSGRPSDSTNGTQSRLHSRRSHEAHAGAI